MENTEIKTEAPEFQNLDGFLEIVFETQFELSKKADTAVDFFTPLQKKLESILDHDTLDEVEEMLWNAYGEHIRYVSIEAMRLAIGIENGTYVPYCC